MATDARSVLSCTGQSLLSSVVPPDLPKTLLCPSDIETSIAAYENLLQTAKSYRNQLASLSQSANAFGAALEQCSRTKGVDEAADSLSNVAGLQYLLANHQSVLSDTIYRSFEIPLRENLENFVVTTEQRREEYKNDLSAKMKLLSKREKEHLALAHKKQRSLNKFREALADLTTLADDIEKLKSDYFYKALDYHCETWSRVAIRSNIVCKAELSLYAGVAQKAEHLEWSLVGTPDPWNQDARCGDEIFQIVPPQAILARPQSPSHEISAGLFQSLLGAVEAQDSPGPPRRTHHPDGRINGKEVHEASFFSVRQESMTTTMGSKGGSETLSVADRRSVDEQKREVKPHELLTTRINSEDPTSPYQDAEESMNENYGVQQPSRPKSSKSHDETSMHTPSRPSSKRSNLQVLTTPNRKQNVPSRDLASPRPKSRLRLPTDLYDPNSKDLPTLSLPGARSPESDTGTKHSEYWQIKQEPED